MTYRFSVAIVFLGAIALLLSTERSLPAGADDKKTEANLKKEVSQLQTQVNQLQTANNQGQTTQKTLQSTIDGYRGAGLIHIVMLKSKIDASKTDTTDSKAKTDIKTDSQKLIDDAYSQLAKIKGVRGFWAGKPAASTSSTSSSSSSSTSSSSSSATSSSDTSSDFTIAMVLAFDDAAGLKAYLNDSVHTKFTDKYLKNYETPIVFDIEPRKPQP